MPVDCTLAYGVACSCLLHSVLAKEKTVVEGMSRAVDLVQSLQPYASECLQTG